MVYTWFESDLRGFERILLILSNIWNGLLINGFVDFDVIKLIFKVLMGQNNS